MKYKTLLPNPAEYINYIENIILNYFSNQLDVDANVLPTTEVAKTLVNRDKVIIVQDTDKVIGQ